MLIKRKKHQFKKDDTLLAKSLTQKSEPKYLPVAFRTISINDTDVCIQCIADKTIFYHHKDDIKHCTFDTDTSSPEVARVPLSNHPKFLDTTNSSTLITSYSTPTSSRPAAHIVNNQTLARPKCFL